MLFEIIKTALKLLLGRGSVRSYSQFGEDAATGAMLRQKEGFYVDVGAFHPMLYSNTYLFYRRGWRGIAVDPNPRARALFRLFRPRDTFYETGVGEAGRVPYVLFSDPAYNTFDRQTAEKYQHEGIVRTGTRETEITPLRDILKKEGVTHIDVLAVDVEGKDVEVLTTHDWNIPTRIVIVEDHDFQIAQKEKSECYRFLSERGYVLKALCGPSLIFSK